MIKSWSYSRLTDFEKCAYLAKLKVIDKIPEPERPLKPGQTEHANDRGTRIHDGIEKFIRGKGDMPAEAEKNFGPLIRSLREHFESGKVRLEEEWGFDRDWKPCDYKGAWLRMKCDAVWEESKHAVTVIDYKTGRKFGNEIKHGEQVQLYALAAAIRYPSAKDIDVKLWYIDLPPNIKDPRQANVTEETKPASKWLYHLKPFNNRGRKMTEATEFKPNPSKYACLYCPYKDGICEYAYIGAGPVRRKGQK